ncbi:MAG: riboflavin synthase [Alphaproteobacteria bacterium]|nr:riboflavin synthase [Alphaproteobacteria bacterium]
MFTGIVTDVGRVRAIEKRGDTRLVIETAYDTAAVDIGASIACSGPCLTVVDKGPGWFAVEASAETLARTTIGGWREKSRVNLERAVRVGDELGGHIVTGHVDAIGRLIDRTPEGDSVRCRFEVPETLKRYIAEKGSVAVDGVSLTINEVAGARFGVNIISHTRAHTTLGALAVGDRVNIEVDVIARYVARMVEKD